MAFGQWKSRVESVNALSGLYLISTYTEEDREAILSYCVNALSGLYLISTGVQRVLQIPLQVVCQCPLGLIPHFYGET